MNSPWVLDNDPFSINQFLHPYQGSMYHGFARSAGLNYWESLGYTFAGSMLWEIAGETTLPSRNDQIASGFGGSLFGEPLFRLAGLVLEKSRLPRFWRELSAAVISPSRGFNRLAYGDRFRREFPSRDPAFSARVQFGMMATASVRKSVTQSFTRNEAVADFSVDYGLPGNSSYAYRRPFDYFNFQFTSSTGSRFENIFSRGLLAGRSYGEAADSTRGSLGTLRHLRLRRAANLSGVEHGARSRHDAAAAALRIGCAAEHGPRRRGLRRRRRYPYLRRKRLSFRADAAGARRRALHSRR